MCPICERHIPDYLMTKHHLIPRSKGGKDIEFICLACHNQIHLLFSNRELESNLNNVQKIQNHTKMKSFIQWIRKRPAETIPNKKKSNRR